MACYNHPDKEAVATCSVCGNPICSDCHVEIGGSSYCTNCISSLIDSEDIINDESQTIENIEPISKPKTVPFAEDNSVDVNENFNEVIPKVEKSLDNYQPEYDYQTQYVESYGDTDVEEDSYYENPEVMPEPKEEYYVVKEQVIGEAKPKEVYSEPVQNNVDNSLESKYEKYLDDIYYDESSNPQYGEPVYRRPMNAQYNEPVYRESSNPQYGEPVYREPMNAQYGRPAYQEEYSDDYIVPVYQDNHRTNGPSYEEIKRKLEMEGIREPNPRYEDSRYDPRFDVQRYDDPRYDSRRNSNNLEDIQKMHNESPKKDNSFTTVEIILTVILIILIIIVGFYIIYLFALSTAYGSFLDALMGLVQNPGLFLSNLLN